MRKLLWNFRDDDSVTSDPTTTTETPVVSNPTPNFQDASEDENSSPDLGDNFETFSPTNDTSTEKSIVQDDVKLVTPPLTSTTSPMTKSGFEQDLVENNSTVFPPQNPNFDSGDEETGLVLTPTTSKDDYRLVNSKNSTFPNVETMKDDVVFFNKTKTDIIHPKLSFKNSTSPGSTVFNSSTINGVSNIGNTSLTPFATPKPGIENSFSKFPAQVPNSFYVYLPAIALCTSLFNFLGIILLGYLVYKRTKHVDKMKYVPSRGEVKRMLDSSRSITLETLSEWRTIDLSDKEEFGIDENMGDEDDENDGPYKKNSGRGVKSSNPKASINPSIGDSPGTSGVPYTPHYDKATSQNHSVSLSMENANYNAAKTHHIKETNYSIPDGDPNRGIAPFPSPSWSTRFQWKLRGFRYKFRK